MNNLAPDPQTTWLFDQTPCSINRDCAMLIHAKAWHRCLGTQEDFEERDLDEPETDGKHGFHLYVLTHPSPTEQGQNKGKMTI